MQSIPPLVCITAVTVCETAEIIHRLVSLSSAAFTAYYEHG
jgi:hypothetical protein